MTVTAKTVDDTMMMRAATRDRDGPPEVLRIAERPRPQPASDEILVRVAYAGLNRADLLERAGRYGRIPTAAGADPAEVAIAGIEFSGTVVSRGANVSGLEPGDRVCAITTSGAHAEYVAINAQSVARLPEGVGLREAAVIPEAFLTAYDALFTRGRFRLGEAVLIHAVGSGVGLAAVALATHAGGLVFGTSRTPSKLERAKAFGMRAGFAVDDGFIPAVHAATEGRGVDVVLDFIGGAELDRNIQALCVGGRIVQIGTLAGTHAWVNLGALMGKRATLVGTVLRTRALDEKIGLARILGDRILPRFADGTFSVVIDKQFELDEIARAHEYMEASENFGKIVIAVDPPAEEPT